MRALLVLVALVGVAHADTWRVTNRPGVLATPARVCRAEFNTWVMSVASERPSISIDGDTLTLQLGTSTMVTAHTVIGKDFAMGFWDQGKGVTLAIRVHPLTAKIEILFIKHYSETDRGDACYVEWRGDVER